MRCRLALALVTAFAVQEPASLPTQTLTLELRVFDGTEEVTAHTRTTLHRPEDHGEPLFKGVPSGGRLEFQVPAGIYDAQAIHEREGRVLNIRWANRLVVMAYPDELGHHLEVINFKNGYGALQIREPGGAKPDAAIYEAGDRAKPATTPHSSTSYLLFVVRAGTYDLLSRRSGKASWYVAVDVPLDRTRLWVAPDTREQFEYATLLTRK